MFGEWFGFEEVCSGRGGCEKVCSGRVTVNQCVRGKVAVRKFSRSGWLCRCPIELVGLIHESNEYAKK